MTNDACFINGVWRSGSGSPLESVGPSDESIVWSGREASSDDVADAMSAARSAQPGWEASSLAERESILRRYAELVDSDRSVLAKAISVETGKPLWEALTEVGAVVGKVGLSIEAHAEQNPSRAISETAGLTHRPVGVVGVLGPFNFPAHLANGQIVPALLAGNTVVYKPSELTPGVAAVHVRLLAEAGVPDGVINLVIGGRKTGEALVESDLDAIAFTGSVATGQAIHRSLAARPHVLLALEMGGNNPLVVADIADQDAAVNVIVRSAFITSGQRCTCARRLYVPRTAAGDALIDALVATTDQLTVGPYPSETEPFMGPVVNRAAADRVRRHVDELVNSGATRLTRDDPTLDGAFVRPTILDADTIALDDEEVFGPVLTVHRFDDLNSAFAHAADTKFGLAAGLISSNRDDFDRFQKVIRAGVINLNCPTTGASGRLPFGGVGASGNHRPAGWAAADFCAYPVATMTYDSVSDAVAPIQGLA